MTNRSQKSGQRLPFVIFHWSFVIFFLCAPSVSAVKFLVAAWLLCEISVPSVVVRKNVSPASSRQTVLLTQKELSRLTCRRDAGATILSHDLRLCGEILGCGWAAL